MMHAWRVVSLVLSFIFLSFGFVTGQKRDLFGTMYKKHEDIRYPGLEQRRFSPSVVHKAVGRLKSSSGFRVHHAGNSANGLPIHVVAWGNGPVRILLWSQMHGDESTATRAMLDVWQALDKETFLPERNAWRDVVTLYFIPLLNPDGAAMYHRRNAIGVDLNRDALRRTTPEAQLLWHWRDSLKPEWGFNLHDQHRYYSVGQSDKSVAMAFLAPPPDIQRTVPPHRSDAMKVIVGLDRQLQKVIPGQVARYSDGFEERAFGDQFTAAGTSTMLFEGGWITGDDEKQQLRRLYFASMIEAIQAIASGSYRDENVSEYQKIPFNQNRLYDLLIREATYFYRGRDYVLDVGIKHDEKPTMNGASWYKEGRIEDIGDLSPFDAHHVMQGKGLRIVPSKSYNHVLSNRAMLADVPIALLVRQGTAVFRVAGLGAQDRFREIPLSLRLPEEDTEETLFIGKNPVFYLIDANDHPRYLIVNGVVWDLRKDQWEKSLQHFIASGLE